MGKWQKAVCHNSIRVVFNQLQAANTYSVHKVVQLKTKQMNLPWWLWVLVNTPAADGRWSFCTGRQHVSSKTVKFLLIYNVKHKGLSNVARSSSSWQSRSPFNAEARLSLITAVGLKLKMRLITERILSSSCPCDTVMCL